MFSGIVAAVGRISQIIPLAEGVRLQVDTASLPLDDVQLGDSIAVNGVCLTVVEFSTQPGAQHVTFDVSRETLNCTVGLDAPGDVNLEKALRLSDRLGGHLVSGHVDGVGEVIRFAAIGESHELIIRAPHALARYIARKGSIAVQGVSLTVNSVTDEPAQNEQAGGCVFSINLIPHTVEVTTLKHCHAGALVNLEIDLMARYAERMLVESRVVA